MKTKLTLALAFLIMVATSVAHADLSPHTKAVLDGTLSKSPDAKGYVVHVEKATTPEGKEITELKGKDLPLPANMSAECAKQCGSCCDKACKITCEVDAKGNITSVTSITGRDMTKPGTKGN